MGKRVKKVVFEVIKWVTERDDYKLGRQRCEKVAKLYDYGYKFTCIGVFHNWTTWPHRHLLHKTWETKESWLNEGWEEITKDTWHNDGPFSFLNCADILAELTTSTKN